MIFDDLIEEDWKDDLDKKIDAQKMRSRDWRAHYMKHRSYQPSPQSNIPPMPQGTYHNSRWVIKNKVMRSGRPGYYSGNQASDEVVKPWLNKIINSTGQLPKSIITFLTDKELDTFYDFDLIQKYKDMGFVVKRMPKNDPAYSGGHGNVFSVQDVEQIKKWIKELPKPVLLHCSAGIDRTGEICEYLKPSVKPKENKKNDGESLIKSHTKDEDGTERIYLRDGEIWQRDAGSPKWYRIQNAGEQSSIQSQVDKFRNKYGDWKNVK